MDEKNSYVYIPPTFEENLKNFKNLPSSGLNYDVFSEGIKSGKLSPDQQSELNDTFVKGYNQALHLCFPGDAFKVLRGQNLIAENIPPQAHLDLDQEWKEIAELTKINVPQQDITTEAAYQHFRLLKREDFPEYEATHHKISLYISECIRRAHKENNHLLFDNVIPTFKLLAYLHKLHEGNHYFCPDEYNEMVRWGTDPKKLEFITIKKEDVKERFY